MPAQPLAFNLSLDDNDDESVSHRIEDNDSRLMEMLAAQAAHRETGSVAASEESIIANKAMTETEKKAALQRLLHNAASNGDVEQVEKLLKGPAKTFVDINGPDEEGTAPIIYASCFVCLVHRPWFYSEARLLIISLGSSRRRSGFVSSGRRGRSAR